MGNHTSNTITETEDVVNSTTINQLSSTQNTAAQNVLLDQSFDLAIGPGAIVQCADSISFTLTGQVTADYSANFSSDSAESTAASLNAALDAAAQSSNSVVSGFLNTSIADSNDNKQTINQHLQNIITTNSNAIVVNSCTSNYTTVQHGSITIIGTLQASNCNFGENAQLNLIMSCVFSSIANLVAQDSTLSNNMLQAAASNNIVSTGPIQEIGTAISEGLDALANLFGSLSAPIYIILGIAAAVIVLAVLLKILSGKKKKAAEAAAQAQAAAAGGTGVPGMPGASSVPSIPGAPNSATSMLSNPLLSSYAQKLPSASTLTSVAKAV